MKKGLAVLMALMLVCVLTACGGNSIAGTYTVNLITEEISGNLTHNGYLVAIQSVQTNTLILNEDGTYSYTKVVTGNREGVGGVNLSYTFIGTYTAEDMVVTLHTPTDCEFNEDWGPFTDHGFQNSSGKHSEGATVQCKAESGHEPLNMFLTPYLVDSDETGEVVITVDVENSTFSYNEVVSSDDE